MYSVAYSTLLAHTLPASEEDTKQGEEVCSGVCGERWRSHLPERCRDGGERGTVMAVEPMGTYRPNTMELEVVTRTACSIPFEVRVRFSSELAVRLARRIVQPQVVGREGRE